MKVNDKIRLLREMNRWTQEEMAERLDMSHNGYAKIERGETKLYLDKLNQIAQIFNINLSDLVAENDKNIFFFLHETHDHTSANYFDSNKAHLELEKLKLTVAHKDEIIARQNQELSTLQEIIALLKQQHSS